MTWLDRIADVHKLSKSLFGHHHAIIRSIGGRVACVSVVQDRSAVAFGLGVLEAAHVGIFT
ncbi:hypothetical protein EDF56_11444 [Novosphingobium sp. PhB165]|nr:hypothetical protein EDF56_11444 [Novosphingobium sp. PhB165]